MNASTHPLHLRLSQKCGAANLGAASEREAVGEGAWGGAVVMTASAPTSCAAALRPVSWNTASVIAGLFTCTVPQWLLLSLKSSAIGRTHKDGHACAGADEQCAKRATEVTGVA
eukprot:5472546-Pleurochrysis_carterae.AAC.3